jgi:hypothetical protein
MTRHVLDILYYRRRSGYPNLARFQFDNASTVVQWQARHRFLKTNRQYSHILHHIHTAVEPPTEASIISLDMLV